MSGAFTSPDDLRAALLGQIVSQNASLIGPITVHALHTRVLGALQTPEEAIGTYIEQGIFLLLRLGFFTSPDFIAGEMTFGAGSAVLVSRPVTAFIHGDAVVLQDGEESENRSP